MGAVLARFLVNLFAQRFKRHHRFFVPLRENKLVYFEHTIILAEHRLEEAFPFATRVIVMDNGAIICDDKPENVGLQLKDRGSGMFLAMPTAMRVWAAVETKLSCPMTVRDGSGFLSRRVEEQQLLFLAEKDARLAEAEQKLAQAQTEIDGLSARVHAMGHRLGVEVTEDTTSREYIAQLEREYAWFVDMFEKNWKLTKKRIRKDILWSNERKKKL